MSISSDVYPNVARHYGRLMTAGLMPTLFQRSARKEQNNNPEGFSSF